MSYLPFAPCHQIYHVNNPHYLSTAKLSTASSSHTTSLLQLTTAMNAVSLISTVINSLTSLMLHMLHISLSPPTSQDLVRRQLAITLPITDYISSSSLSHNVHLSSFSFVNFWSYPCLCHTSYWTTYSPLQWKAPWSPMDQIYNSQYSTYPSMCSAYRAWTL